jgi:hypothetical protein
MIDPVSAFAVASAAYNAVKKGIEMGQELDGMAGRNGAQHQVALLVVRGGGIVIVEEFY